MVKKLNPDEILGTRSGRIVAVELRSVEHRYVNGKKLGYKYNFLWKCDCGNEKVIELKNIRDGRSKSCGCLSVDKLVARSLKHGKAKKYGEKRTPEYKAWVAMNDRCYCRASASYQLYGADGVTVTDEWRGENGFMNFLRDMGTKPTLKHSVDRIDNSLGYSKENCRWASPVEQANNKTNNVLLVYQGEQFTLPNLIRSLGLGMENYKTYYARYKRGWSVDRTMHEPI